MTAKEKEAEAEKNDEKPKIVMEPPDGGWGWIIIFAAALSNFITIPIMQSFGLLFQERFVALNMTATDLSVIINVNSAFGMSMGLLNGPLLRRFGYRKIALAGSILSFVGITATSWANSFVFFLISYSIITSMGGFLLMSSFSLALNTYFRKRRGRAAGMSTTVTGLGPVFMPQIITYLLFRYGNQGTTLILGGLALHSVAAALLLQPVKWHMKPVVQELETSEESKNMLEEDNIQNNRKSLVIEVERKKRSRTNTLNSIDYEYDHDVDAHSMYGFETPLVSHRNFGSSVQIAAKRKASNVSFQRSISQADDDGCPVTQKVPSIPSSYPWWESVETVNLGSCVKIFDEKPYYPLKQEGAKNEVKKEKWRDGNNIPTAATKIGIEDSVKTNHNNNKISHTIDRQSASNLSTRKKKQLCVRIGSNIVKFFDLGLLRDPGYLVLMIGMSFAVCAELNFSLFTPMILSDYGFSIEQTATVMSVIALADIIFRFLAPFIGDWLKFSAQSMYLISLLMLITTRILLMLFHEYEAALFVAVSLGVAKGFRTVYMSLVIPSYVPLERLASASGLQMVTNSLFIVASIPVMAYVRDTTGSYNMCIGALNCITLVTVTMWTTQLLFKCHKKHATVMSQLKCMF